MALEFSETDEYSWPEADRQWAEGYLSHPTNLSEKAPTREPPLTQGEKSFKNEVTWCKLFLSQQTKVDMEER